MDVDALLRHWRAEEEQSMAVKPRDSGLGRCARQQQYAMLGAPETNPMDGASIATMEQGRAIEGLLIPALERMGYRVTRSQDELEDEYSTGHPDGVIEGPDLPWPHLLEVKHVNVNAYVRLWRGGVAQTEPAYAAQAIRYMSKMGLRSVLWLVVAQDKTAVKNEIWRARQRNSYDGWAEGLNPKAFTDTMGLDPHADAILQVRARCIRDADAWVVREFDPNKDRFPCIDYCSWHARCVADGEGKVAVTPWTG